MKSLLKHLTLCALLASCESTTLTRPDGTRVHDGSVASNATYQETVITTPDGTRLERKTWGKDQSAALQSWLRWTKAPGLIDASGAALEGGIGAAGKLVN